MATIGRCAGCGFQNQSCKKMDQHIMSCPKYLEYYKANPAGALDPRQEQERWLADEQSPEARAIRKDENLAVRFAALDLKRETQSERWATPPSILDD